MMSSTAYATKSRDLTSAFSNEKQSYPSTENGISLRLLFSNEEGRSMLVISVIPRCRLYDQFQTLSQYNQLNF